MPSLNQLSTEDRRQLQRTIGLVVETKPQPTETRRHSMDTQPNTQTARKPSRAQQVVDHLSAPPTFKELATHELKRAVVWTPILLTTGVAILWANRRFFLSASS